MNQRGARRNLFVVCIFLAVLQLKCWRFSNPIIAYQRRTRLSSSNQPTAEELLDGFDNPPMELFEALYPSVDFGKKSSEIRYDEEAGIFKYVDIPAPISLQPLKKVEYTRKALESIWTDLCRQKIIKGKITQMKIDDLLPHLMNETSIIDIIYKNFRERDEDVLPVYTTFRELRTLWLTNRNSLKINEEKEFNVKEALLLLDDFDPTDLQTSIFGKDEDEDEEEEEAEKKAEKKDAKVKKVKKKKGKKGIVEEEIIEEENVEELIVTDQELRRVWRDKSKQQIGLPSKEYSDSSAFLLLDSVLENDEFDFGDEEYYEAYMLPEINDPPERVPFGKFDPDDEDEDYPTLTAEEWRELGVSMEDLEVEVDEELDADTYTDEFYDAIEEAANELDHTPFFVNPIDRSMDITPGDMLEQFTGEMNYVEFTIDPAVDRIENLNWDSIPGLSNSKLDVLNYLTLPNEEFIDYNIPKKRSWELFDFPWGPDYDQFGGRRNSAQPETESDAKNQLSAYQVENFDGVLKFPEDEDHVDHEEVTTKLSQEEEDELFGDIDSVDDDGEIEGTEEDEESDNNNVDWDNFDFGAVNGDESPATSLKSSLPSSDPNSELYDEDAYEDDWMQFHSVILAKQAKEKGFRRKLRYDEGLYTPFMDEYVNSSLWDNPNQVYDGLLSKRLENVYSSPIKDFKVPKHWLTRKRYENYVGIEEYNKNIQYEEIGDNMDDVYEILSLQTVLDIMNLYLNDHMKIARKQDDRKAFDRYYQAKLYNRSITYPVLEPIPIMMIPDKDRGIQYSSQIFESNAQYQLFPYVPEPIVAFANESFDANPHTQYEFDSGSLLENYDWFPQKDLIHEIEEDKVQLLQPLIKFINHAGKLLSTKDDIIIFDYYGKMRDLAGIRVMMLGMAKECYPQIKDLRLETSRTHDSFDVGDHDWADPAEYVSRPLVKDDVFI